MYRLPCLLLAALCLASPSLAQTPDAEGSKDHPAIPRLPNYYISNFENPDFAAHDFAIGEDKDTNLKLSQARAEAVRSHLVSTFGIAAARLTTAGFGDTQPVEPNTTEEGRAQNRRVVLVKK